MVSAARIERIASFDGAELALHRLGAGKPVVLLHGLFSSARMNWLKFGHAQALAEAGFEALMPDLRAHGESAAPHDAAGYPPGVLVRDVEAVVAALKLAEFDLVGFSLGARTALGAVAAGLAPRRLVLAGMGLESLSNGDRRFAFFVDAIDRFEAIRQGDPAYVAKQFMKTMRIDRAAARLLLTRGIGDLPGNALAALTMPTLVVAGVQDRDNGSPRALAEALTDARFEEVPGSHMSSVTEPALGQAIVRFLSEA
ncbi:MAG: alpha/beta fold hydrolase [Croceibacterium sp.]